MTTRVISSIYYRQAFVITCTVMKVFLQSLELFGTEYFKMAVLLARIYLFYLSGRIMSHWKRSRKTKVNVIHVYEG